jgi:hypothetical protein
MKTIENRFNEKIEKITETGCWLWTAGVDKNGYGVIGVSRKAVKAHRLSWLLFRGVLNTEDQVLHHCDIPCCVNPSHLFIGTHIDNMADMKAKNRARGAKGEKNHKAKLTPEQIARIKYLLQNNRSCNSIAKEYGVVHSTISRIKRGEGWL